jgi:ABC-type phosphate transport system substrate-binding protein
MSVLRVVLAAVLLIGWGARDLSVAAAAEPALRIGGTGSALGAARLLLDALTERNPQITGLVLPSVGTSGAIKAVAAGALDIGLTARPLKAAERDLGLIARPFGKTAVVFAGAADNPPQRHPQREVIEITRKESRRGATAARSAHPAAPVGRRHRNLMRFLPRLAAAWREAAERRVVPVAYTDRRRPKW